MLSLTRQVASCLAAFLFTGCGDSLDFATRRPHIKDLGGEYIPVEAPAQRLKGEGYPRRDILIVLAQDGRLRFRNTPDCWLSQDGMPHGDSDSGTGRWELTADGRLWSVGFYIETFEPFSAY